ncbi:hypothetical protein ULG90_15015 [Halopseudomonas pachastrellae]|nr:hypothetical protein ULG90_15015 [Halopseudomonas pachastrellae]
MGKDRLDLLPGVFDQQLYALALPTGSNLRDEVNEAILRLTESPEWRLIQRAYLGERPEPHRPAWSESPFVDQQAE